MLQVLKNAFCTPLYIQIWENRIKVTNIKSGDVFETQPYVAILTTDKGQRRILDIGYDARTRAAENVKVINPFSHPRTLLGDFEVATKLIQYTTHEASKSKPFLSRNIAVIHPMEKTEGGLSFFESKALTELAQSAGMTRVHIHEGTEIDTSNFDINIFSKPKRP